MSATDPNQMDEMALPVPASWSIPMVTASPSLRDYFIAHAPAEPQPWFRPRMPDPIPHKWRGRDAKTGELLFFLDHYSAEKRCGDDGYWDENEKAREAWAEEFTKQGYIQWPAAWADAMLEARKS